MELIAYLLHRQTQEGFLDSVAPAMAQDHVRLFNAQHSGKKKKSSADDTDVNDYLAGGH